MKLTEWMEIIGFYGPHHPLLEPMMRLQSLLQERTSIQRTRYSLTRRALASDISYEDSGLVVVDCRAKKVEAEIAVLKEQLLAEVSDGVAF